MFRYPNLRTTGQAKDTEGAALPKQTVKPPPTSPAMQQYLPPPTSLLHPTLLEKMRLDSPSTAHMHLSTRNKQQTDNEINETFYKIQNAAPFPKLPPFFVHKSEAESHGGGMTDCIPPVSHVKRPTSAGLGKVSRRFSIEESEEGSDSRTSSARRSIQNTWKQNGGRSHRSRFFVILQF